VERLTTREGRVVASLVEKQLTIPQYYPLTLNALVAACNQSSSRDPVTDYGEAEVLEAVESLKAKRLVRSVLPTHGRSVVRYRQILDETLGLDPPQLAVLAVLELRGPQTAAELRARTERLAAFDSVDHELDLLASRDEPLVERLARRPGQKEERWTSLLAGPSSERPDAEGALIRQDDAMRETRSSAPPVESALPAGGVMRADVDGLRRDLDEVRDELHSLRAGLGDLRRELDELRTNLGG
jgi:uncharacterized protein YceH (UPF0502 family)